MRIFHLLGLPQPTANPNISYRLTFLNLRLQCLLTVPFVFVAFMHQPHSISSGGFLVDLLPRLINFYTDYRKYIWSCFDFEVYISLHIWFTSFWTYAIIIIIILSWFLSWLLLCICFFFLLFLKTKIQACHYITSFFRHLILFCFCLNEVIYCRSRTLTLPLCKRNQSIISIKKNKSLISKIVFRIILWFHGVKVISL